MSKKQSTNQNTNEDDELENANQAFIEMKFRGSTSRRCLRCGSLLRVYDGGSGYRIWCERNNCFTMTVRGV